jgi:hypothetical protein
VIRQVVHFLLGPDPDIAMWRECAERANRRAGEALEAHRRTLCDWKATQAQLEDALQLAEASDMHRQEAAFWREQWTEANREILKLKHPSSGDGPW